MNKETNVFKDYSNLLYEYQKPVFNDIQTYNMVLLKAKMDFGKTYLSCVYVSYLLKSGRIKSATFSISNYQMRDKILSDLQKIGLNDKLSVCLEGKGRSFMPTPKGKQQTRIGTILKEIHNLKGIVDVGFIRKRWPKANPYKVLMALQDYADVIIIHHSMLNTNKKVRKTDLLIVDDADLMNRENVFTIAKYKVFQEHLQAIEDSITDAKEIREKISRHKEKLPLLNAMLYTLYSYLSENPEQLETTFITEIELRIKTMEGNPLFRLWMKDKTADEVAEEYNKRKRSNILIGIKQASNPVKLSSLMDLFKHTLRNYTDGLEDKISNEISYAITLHIDHKLEDFFNALLNPKFNIKQSQIDKDWSTIEINMSNGSDFMDVVNGYNNVLWLSATADPQEFEGFFLIESKFDPHSDHKGIQIISMKMVPDVLAKLRNNNVFVITKSMEGAEEFKSQYGGEILTSETYESIVRNAKNSKGNLTIGYVNGIGSRGLDGLAMLYDAVLVYSWIYKSVIQKDGEFYDESFISQNLNDASQLIGRIMRGSSEHILILIKDDSEIGSKLQERIYSENPDWKHIDNLDEVISKIPERTMKEERKTILHKETRILKDGSKELIYRAKATDDKIESAPNQLEI